MDVGVDRDKNPAAWQGGGGEGVGKPEENAVWRELGGSSPENTPRRTAVELWAIKPDLR